MKEMLGKPIIREEIKAEFFALPSNKTPGPDGFMAEFFKKMWPAIGMEFLDAVSEFFSSGRILTQWNSTTITLVPKKQTAERITVFRPISCCNVLYKVISKLLARRLERILPYWISPFQSAFVKGRLLLENVLLATELVKGYEQQNVSKRGVLKVDLRKTFDTVGWNYILEVMVVADVPKFFVTWVRQCISTTSFSVNINGSLCGYLNGTKGMRQGDPLSPSLFVIAMEALARILERKYADGSIGYHPKAKDMAISSLAFADDLMIFYDGKPSSLSQIIDVLSEFKLLSGLHINRDKSAIYFAGLDDLEMEETAAYGFINGNFPFRYLGLPLLHRKLRKQDFNPLLDQISSRLTIGQLKIYLLLGGYN